MRANWEAFPAGHSTPSVSAYWHLDDAPDHSIRNMALLSSEDNSRLSNSVFEVKRHMMLELEIADLPA
jgi:hypothetical protein